jgi:hypothetical protein
VNLALRAGWLLLAYAGVALGLLWLLSACVERISPRLRLGLLLLPLCFTGSAILQGKVYAPADLAFRSLPLAAHREELGIDATNPVLSDVHQIVIPWRAEVYRALRSGRWPLWSSSSACGEPLAGSAQPAAYAVPVLAGLLVPLRDSFALTASLLFLLAAASGFVYARALGCREETAWLGGAAWAMSNFLVFWGGWPHSLTVLWLPLLLVAVDRVVAVPSWRSSVLLALVLSQVVLGGHTETALHVVAVGAAVGVWKVARAPGAMRLGAVSHSLLGGAIAVGLTAFYLLPHVDVVLQSQRWALREASHAAMHTGDWGYAWRALVADLYPFFHGFASSQTASYRPPFWIVGSSSYVGSVLLPLAIWGAVRGRSPERGPLLGLLAAGLVLGAKTPLFFPALGLVPLFRHALNERLVFLAAFATCMLAALGLEAAWRATAWRPLARLAGGVTLAYLLGCLALLPAMRAGGLPDGMIALHATLAVVPLALSVMCYRLRRAASVGMALLAALLLVQRVGEMGRFYQSVDERVFYPEVAPLDALPHDGSSYRVVALGSTFLPNDATMYGLEDARGYNGVYHHRFSATWPLWTAPELGYWYLSIGQLERPFLSFLNVRYALQPETLPVPAGWQSVTVGSDTRLLHNPAALNRAFVPPRLRLAGDRDRDLAWLRSRADFRRTVLLEPLDGGADLRSGVVTNGRGRVLAIRRAGTEYRLEMAMEETGWVVLSETHWRGWRARTGGRELPLGYAHHAFLAFEVPAGRHEVEVFYRPRSFEIGLALLVATIVALAAWWAAPSWSRRRRARAAQTFLLFLMYWIV